MLLLGKDQAMQALLPAARLHLARGDHDLARAAARRGLRAVGGDRLRAVELFTILVDAELARGDVAAASAACEEMDARIVDVGLAGLRARAAAARARTLAAAGDIDRAIVALEASVDQLDTVQLPWLRAVLLLDLARLRDQSGDVVTAGFDAKAAAAVFAALDVTLSPADAALLERLVPPASNTRTPIRTASLARDEAGWVASFGGSSVRLHDTKGMRYLAEVVAGVGVERHVLDLVDCVEGVASAADGLDRRRLGDAGDVLDARARAAYRHRIEQLRADADDALAAGHLDAAEGHQAELDLLVAQLAQAFGLGGRSRRAASAAERARLNVTRALRTAIARVAAADPVAGDALDRRVRTGLYCAYEPDDGDEIRWIVHSGLNDVAAR
jgi:hypothetical protein